MSGSNKIKKEIIITWRDPSSVAKLNNLIDEGYRVTMMEPVAKDTAEILAHLEK